MYHLCAHYESPIMGFDISSCWLDPAVIIMDFWFSKYCLFFFFNSGCYGSKNFVEKILND